MWEHIFEVVAQSIPQTVAWLKLNPEFFLVPLGTAFSLCISQGLQIIWFPERWSARIDLQVMSLIDLVLTFIFVSQLWRLLDGQDGLPLIHTVAAGTAGSTLLLHVFLLRIALHRWPWIDPPPGP